MTIGQAGGHDFCPKCLCTEKYLDKYRLALIDVNTKINQKYMLNKHKIFPIPHNEEFYL